ncbi:PREDICTED: glutamate receptor 2.8-like [Nelumbo nucifera]|uniref:Glutamate receptor n=2 Tax=Nelumbo nucifera TaxID=4432 RepID=A0A822ZL78_NELNU|nr:PREDICTED: glutamate receptor 2.8-like [Nelumbo nucifera]DAD45503.1 TPA_asm: hypothetical protein HUJ06_003733 [Nelumbo nucifera]
MKYQSYHFFLLFLCSSLSFYPNMTKGSHVSITSLFHVGVVLDSNSVVGSAVWRCIERALLDFYAIHPSYGSRIILRVRDWKGDAYFSAVSLAMDLIEDVGVQAIIGPDDFLVALGNKVHIPIFSFSSYNFSLSPSQFPYFVRIAQNKDSSHVKEIAGIVQAYQRREVSVIHDDTDESEVVIPYLIDALREIGAQVRQRIILPYTAETEVIMDTLFMLEGTKTRVFIVHLCHSLGSSFILQVKEAGMMKPGYLWIATSAGLTDPTVHKHSTFCRSGEGVIIGVKPKLPPSQVAHMFENHRRRQVQKEDIDMEKIKLNVYAALWAYNALWVMTNAVEKADFGSTKNFWSTADDLSKMLAPKFEMVNATERQNQDKSGNPTHGSVISRRLLTSSGNATENILPNSTVQPEVTCKNASDVEILKIAVPYNTTFDSFVSVRNSMFNGFSIEVFDAVMSKLHYCYKYVAFDFGDSYNSMTDMVYHQEFDGAVGDITITAHRLNIVDFTQPYTGSGVRMIVPIQHERDTDGLWWFFKPFTLQLWLTTFVVFILKGVLVWLFENGKNPEFQGEHQLGRVLYFSFSLFVFAQKENLQTNYSRFVIYLWMFTLFVIVASYNANLTSILTVDNLRPSVTSLDQLVNDGSYVGYQKGSFVYDLLKERFPKEKLINLSTPTEFAQALSNKSVAAIVEEVPVINVFLKMYCNQFTIAGPTIQTGGFGFAFQKKYSTMISEVSEQILAISENQVLDGIENKYFGHQTCLDPSVQPS